MVPGIDQRNPHVGGEKSVRYLQRHWGASTGNVDSLAERRFCCPREPPASPPEPRRARGSWELRECDELGRVPPGRGAAGVRRGGDTPGPVGGGRCPNTHP